MASGGGDSDARASTPDTDSAHKMMESLSLPSTFEVSVNLSELCQTTLVSLWEGHKYTDVTFLINGHPVPAHKAILASQSEYFSRMLFGELKEASMDEIPLENVSLETFQTVLQFAYSGTLHMKGVPLQAILEVVASADHFRLVALKDALVDILSNRISLDTVIPLLVHSDTYHLPELYKKCLCFIEDKANTMKVLQSSAFLYLSQENLIQIISRDTLVAPELAIFKAVVQWKEHNSSSAEETGRILQHIRLGEFSLQEIFNEVEPTGLFSQDSIMTTLRLQYTSGVIESQGRGRKEVNQNLFSKPAIIFDSTTPLDLHQPEYYYDPTGGKTCVKNTLFYLGFQSKRREFSGSNKLDRCTMIVSLDDVYIVNYFIMKGYPDTPHEKQKRTSFSYTVEVSRDKSNWLKLFDYSSFDCRCVQNLPFPKQAIRYIKVNLTGKQDASQPVPLQLCVCSYLDYQKPFKFLPKGVIAPQFEKKVVAIHFTKVIDNIHMCLAQFNQPYSASLIRFKLNCSDPNAVEVDITVYAGVSDEDRNVQNVEKAALQSPVVVQMQERVIKYVVVTIKKVYRGVDSSKGESPGCAESAATEEVDAGPVFKIVDVFCMAAV